jgi:hypothetical protein
MGESGGRGYISQITNPQICYIFRKCGNLRICDLRINQKKFADLEFVDLHT